MSTATEQKCQSSRCKRTVVKGRRRCLECLERARRYNIERLKKRREAGLCQSCGREQPMDGYTRCRRCAERYYGFTGQPQQKEPTEAAATFDPGAWYMTFHRDESPTVFEPARNPG